MASNHTQNFALNQWLADDQVLREDFNRDNAILEETLSRLSFITGTYTGTGLNASNSQTIELGFEPALLMVFAHRNIGGPDPSVVTSATRTVQYGSNTILALNGTSFAVKAQLNIKTNESSGESVNPYRYIAWRR